MKCSEGKLSEVMISGEMCVLSPIYSHVRSVYYVISLLFASLCYILITRLMFCNIIFMFVFCFVFLFSILCFRFLLYWFVYSFSFCAVSAIFVHVYRPLPPGGDRIAVNKYITYHIVSYHISHHIYIIYHVSYNIYHVSYISHHKTKLRGRTRTIPTERPPPVGEVSANFCG